MALEMEQIDKVNVSTKANNIEKKKNERNVIRIQQMELKRRSWKKKCIRAWEERLLGRDFWWNEYTYRTMTKYELDNSNSNQNTVYKKKGNALSFRFLPSLSLVFSIVCSPWCSKCLLIYSSNFLCYWDLFKKRVDVFFLFYFAVASEKIRTSEYCYEWLQPFTSSDALKRCSV